MNKVGFIIFFAFINVTFLESSCGVTEPWERRASELTRIGELDSLHVKVTIVNVYNGVFDVNGKYNLRCAIFTEVNGVFDQNLNFRIDSLSKPPRSSKVTLILKDGTTIKFMGNFRD